MAHPQAVRALATVGAMVVGWLAAKALHLAPTKARSGWAGFTTVRQASGEQELLTRALMDVIDEGASPIFCAKVVDMFVRHIQRQLRQHKAARLCLPMIVECVAAANNAMWSARDGARLLIALQKELDAEGAISLPYLQQAIAMVREGKSVSEILGKGGALSVPKSLPF